MQKNIINPKAKKSTAAFDTQFKLSFLYPNNWTTWIIILLSYVLYLLPVSFIDYLGEQLGKLIRIKNKKRFNIAYKNISLCFPHFSEDEKQSFLKKHFSAYGRSILHYGFILWGSKKVLEKRITFHGKQHIDKALDDGHGVIVMTAHCVV